MRLIDADALQKNIDEIFCCENSNYRMDVQTITRIINESADIGFTIKALHDRDEISSMACNALLRNGYKSMFDLMFVGRIDLMKIRGIGRKNADEIERVMEKYGVRLGGRTCLE